MKKFAFILLVGFSITCFSQSTPTIAAGNNDLQIPRAAGKYNVGRHWTDLADTSRENRKISLFLYYPTSAPGSKEYTIPTEQWRNAYLPVLEKRLGSAAATALVNSKSFFIPNTRPVSGGKFPLLLFSPGLNWSTLEYSYIIQDLVSAGYIVAAVNSSPLAPIVQASTGDMLAEKGPSDKYLLAATDLVFVLNELKRRNSKLSIINDIIDWKRIGAFGHSLGGAAAILASRIDSTIYAAVNMDGDMHDASVSATPAGHILFLNQVPKEFETFSFDQMKGNADRGWRYQQMTKNASKASSGLYISIAGMYHSNFQDYALLSPEAIPENLRKTRLGPIDGVRCLNIITTSLTAYFDQNLKEKQGMLAKIERQYREVRLHNIKP